MSRNSAGTYSLATGNPVSSNTTILSTWANNTLDDIATALTDSLDRNGHGGMLAKLQLTDGSSGVPALCFTNDVTSGLWKIASGMGLGASNTLCIGLTSSAVNVYPGAVFAKGATLTTSTTNGKGLDSTGNGTGEGVKGTGGATNATGVVGQGGGTTGLGGAFTGGSSGGTGLTATGVGSGGFGLVATGGAGSAGVVGQGGTGTAPGGSFTGAGAGSGVDGTGGATGVGLKGTGGATNGTGVAGFGGGTTGIGVQGTGGSGNAIGVSGVGSGTAPGGSFTAGTAASGGTPSAAVELTSGYLKFNSPTLPTSTTDVTGYVTPPSVLSAWAKLTTDGAGNVAVNDGIGVASATISAGAIVVTFAGTFANANYGVTTGCSIAHVNTTGVGAVVFGQTTTAMSLGLDKADGSGAASLATVPCTIHFHAAGRQ